MTICTIIRKACVKIFTGRCLFFLCHKLFSMHAHWALTHCCFLKFGLQGTGPACLTLKPVLNDCPFSAGTWFVLYGFLNLISLPFAILLGRLQEYNFQNIQKALDSLFLPQDDSIFGLHRDTRSCQQIFFVYSIEKWLCIAFKVGVSLKE